MQMPSRDLPYPAFCCFNHRTPPCSRAGRVPFCRCTHPMGRVTSKRCERGGHMANGAQNASGTPAPAASHSGGHVVSARATTIGLMAILLWSFMAGTVRIVSENFGATLGSAPDLHGRRHPAADVPAPGPDSRVPQEIPDYRRPVVRILRIVDIPLAGAGLYRRILGGSEPGQLSVAHDDGAAVGERIPSQARGRQGAAGRDRGHCRRGVGGRR